MFVCVLFIYFCQSQCHMGEKIMLFVILVRAGLFGQPTRREHIMAENGWKPSKGEKIGSTRSFLAKNG